MATPKPTPKPNPGFVRGMDRPAGVAAKKVAATKAAMKATEKAAMSTKGNLSYAEVQKLKKSGKFYGFDGMNGIPAKDAKLKGK